MQGLSAPAGYPQCGGPAAYHVGYCLGERGLCATAAWAAAVGLADVSNPALLYRLRHCGDWLAVLIGQLLTATAPTPAHGRLIRLIDASTVAKPGPEAQKTNKLWRVHAAFDLPAERFGHFELTDEHGGEQLDRIPVVPGEIRIGDRAYLQPDRIAAVLDAGGDPRLRRGRSLSCGPAAAMRVGWMSRANRSICTLNCLAPTIGSTGRYGSAAKTVPLWPCA